MKQNSIIHFTQSLYIHYPSYQLKLVYANSSIDVLVYHCVYFSNWHAFLLLESNTDLLIDYHHYKKNIQTWFCNETMSLFPAKTLSIKLTPCTCNIVWYLILLIDGATWTCLSLSYSVRLNSDSPFKGSNPAMAPSGEIYINTPVTTWPLSAWYENNL